MGFRNISSVALIVGVALFTLTGCPEVCVEPEYTFSIYTYISPEKDSIRVGDTLFLSSEFSKSLTDIQSGRKVDYSRSQPITIAMRILKINPSTGESTGAKVNFNYFSIVGEVKDASGIPSPEKVKNLIYKETESQYELRIGLITKQSGIYFIALPPGLSRGKLNSKKCEKANFIVGISNPNQNLDVVEEALGVPLAEFNREFGYGLKVVE